MLKHIKAYYPGILLLIVAFLISLLTYKDYGIAWDEPAQKLIGDVNYRYVFENDTTLLSFADKEYGAAFELPLIFLEKAFHLTDTREIYIARHLANHLFFLISVFFGYTLIYRLFGKQHLAVIGFIMLAFAPRIYAHSFFNTKDIPFLGAILISLTICQAAFEKLKSYLFLLLGISAGYFTGIRIMGIIPAGLMLALLVTDIVLALIRKQQFKKPLVHLLLFIVGFSVCLYVVWPFLWKDPVGNLLHCFEKLAHKELAAKIPMSYLPEWFSITNPPIWLLAGLAGTVWVITDVCRKPMQYINNTLNRNFIIYLFCFLVPCGLVVFFNAVIYDDWRHLYFIYPSFVLLALFFFNELSVRNYTKPLIAIGAAQIAAIAWFMVANHPFQQVYFNRFVSHDKEYLRKHYDFDYWGTSVYQAYLHLLASHPTAVFKVYQPGFDLYISNNLAMLPAESRKRIQLGTMEQSDYFITTYRYHPEDFEYPVFHAITALNSTIVCIYKIR
jgi:hypothetical protein